MKYKKLRKKYPKFIYKNYSYKILNRDLKISFNFQIEPNIYFSPEIIVENVDKKKLALIGDRTLNNLIFHLGLVEIPTYWKTTCSQTIEIKAGSLNKKQILWWKNLIMNGMGQFFYENKINFRAPDFLKIKTLQRTGLWKSCRGKLKKRTLVPIGGGKDSMVTLEILSSFAKASKDKEKINCFSLNPIKAAKKVMKMADCKFPIIVRRKIDKKLLELNRKGYLNGHTPFSAYLAFLSTLLATIFDFKFIAFSNERSSNEGNLIYLGKVINHQWSKSFEFEKLFREYSKKFLIKDVEYFSFLRPIYEIQIAQLFSQYPKYFPVFLSCNEAFKTNSGRKKPLEKWCTRCPKCLFIFASLYPFIETKKLIKIFRKNLFEDKKLLPLMLRLTGLKDFKPFECVGTKKESQIAFYLSWKKSKEERKHLPYLLKYFEKKIVAKYPNLERDSKRIINSWNAQHNLPKNFEKTIKAFLDKF